MFFDRGFRQQKLGGLGVLGLQLLRHVGGSGFKIGGEAGGGLLRLFQFRLGVGRLGFKSFDRLGVGGHGRLAGGNRLFQLVDLAIQLGGGFTRAASALLRLFQIILGVGQLLFQRRLATIGGLPGLGQLLRLILQLVDLLLQIINFLDQCLVAGLGLGDGGHFFGFDLGQFLVQPLVDPGQLGFQLGNFLAGSLHFGFQVGGFLDRCFQLCLQCIAFGGHCRGRGFRRRDFLQGVVGGIGQFAQSLHFPFFLEQGFFRLELGIAQCLQLDIHLVHVALHDLNQGTPVRIGKLARILADHQVQIADLGFAITGAVGNHIWTPIGIFIGDRLEVFQCVVIKFQRLNLRLVLFRIRRTFQFAVATHPDVLSAIVIIGPRNRRCRNRRECGGTGGEHSDVTKRIFHEFKTPVKTKHPGKKFGLA